jgi:hypothetical protein
MIEAKKMTRTVTSGGPTTSVVDWTDKFLSREWPFAKGLPLPDIDGARAMARSQAGQITSGNIVDGRPTMQLSRGRLEELLELAATSGARMTVEHYAAIDASRRTLNRRWRRGLLRLWCAVTILWAGFIVVAAMISGGPLKMDVVAAVGLGLPLAALVVSIIIIRLSVWVANGFRGGP